MKAVEAAEAAEAAECLHFIKGVLQELF